MFLYQKNHKIFETIVIYATKSYYFTHRRGRKERKGIFLSPTFTSPLGERDGEGVMAS